MEEQFSQRTMVILYVIAMIIRAVKEARPDASVERIVYCLLKETEG